MKKAGVLSEQAEAQAEIIASVMGELMKDHLSSKQDIIDSENRFTYKTLEFKNELSQKIDNVRTELNQKIDDVRIELKQEIDSIKT